MCRPKAVGARQGDLHRALGGVSLQRGKASCRARPAPQRGSLTCMVTTPSSSAASLRIWLASTCASSRMEKSASATAPRSQHATRQSSQRGGRRAPAPAQPGEPGQCCARAAVPAVSSSSCSRAMQPPRYAPPRGSGSGHAEREPPEVRLGPVPRSPQNFLPLLQTRLHTAPAAAGAAAAAAAAAPKLRGRPAPARERGRPPSAGSALGGRGSGRRSAPRGAPRVSGSRSACTAGLTVGAASRAAFFPPSPESPARWWRRAAPEGERPPSYGRWGSHPERGGRRGGWDWGQGWTDKRTSEQKKKNHNRKKEVEGREVSGATTPRYGSAHFPARRRGCGDLWSKDERRGNYPSRPSPPSLLPPHNRPPGPGRRAQPPFPGTSRATGRGPPCCDRGQRPTHPRAGSHGLRPREDSGLLSVPGSAHRKSL